MPRTARGIIVRDWLRYHFARFGTGLHAVPRSRREARHAGSEAEGLRGGSDTEGRRGGSEARGRRGGSETEGLHGGSEAGGRRGGGFRRWRHTRPFWGGLLLLLAGIELILIPLSGILLHGQIKLVIYIGIGGVFGVLIGVLLITCALLLWLTPAHRTFYAIAGVALGLLSFITSNLGGFFVGMLLGITGGSLAYAWTPGQPGLGSGTGSGSGSGSVSGPGSVTGSGSGSGSGSGDEAVAGRGTVLAGAALPLLLAASLLTGHAAAPVEPGLVAPEATTVLTAGSATLDGLSYQGAAKVPLASGGTVTMMKFTLTSMTLSGNVTATVSDPANPGHQTVTTGTSLAFSGGATLYATKLSGSLLGVPVTLTPGSVVSVLLRLLSTVTPAIPVTMTNVTTYQPIVLAGTLQVANLNLAAS